MFCPKKVKKAHYLSDRTFAFRWSQDGDISPLSTGRGWGLGVWSIALFLQVFNNISKNSYTSSEVS